MAYTEEDIKDVVPQLSLAQHRFTLSLDDDVANGFKKDEAKAELEKEIKAHNMVNFYEDTCKRLNWIVDEKLVAQMKEANAKVVADLDSKVKEAEEQEGENEVRELMLAKAEHYVRIGDKETALVSIEETMKKTIGLGQKLDLVLMTIRMGFFVDDHDLIKSEIDKAKQLLDKGGDWERRNRLKVYESLYLMTIRESKKAALLFLESVATFTAYELMDYNRFVFYTVLTSVASLDRNTLKSKVVDAPEILSVIRDIPHISPFLNSLYECKYDEYFKSFADICDQIRLDRYMSPHFRFFCREYRIVAYTQFLESYMSVRLERMAESFGVTTQFMDRELAKFIASGRLNCKIDKVGGVVETNRPDNRNAQYQSTIKQGDILLNRIQKLSRVIDM